MNDQTTTIQSLGPIPVEFICRLRWKECSLSLHLHNSENDIRTIIVRIDSIPSRKDRSAWFPVGHCDTSPDPHHIEGDPCGFDVVFASWAPSLLEDAMPKMDGPNRMVQGIFELIEHLVHLRLAPDRNFYEMEIIHELIDVLNVRHAEGLY